MLKSYILEYNYLQSNLKIAENKTVSKSTSFQVKSAFHAINMFPIQLIILMLFFRLTSSKYIEKSYGHQ